MDQTTKRRPPALNRPPRHTPPRLYRITRWWARVAFKAIARFNVDGLEHVPSQGAFLAVMNHLSGFDPLVGIAISPIDQITFFGAIEHRSDFILGSMADKLGAIWVRRGEMDREAIRIAIDELKCGTALGIAIEGTRSRTGGLLEGKIGAAYLATRTNVPILPAVIWGTEEIKHNVRRLKRTEVHIRIAAPFSLPQGRASTSDLYRHTDRIMFELASLLPPKYRGIYADRF